MYKSLILYTNEFIAVLHQKYLFSNKLRIRIVSFCVREYLTQDHCVELVDVGVECLQFQSIQSETKQA